MEYLRLQIQKTNFFAKSSTDRDDFLQFTIPPDAYDVGSLNYEIKRNNTDEEHFPEAYYPFTIEQKISTSCGFVEISKQNNYLVLYPMTVLEIS